jgi:ABC-type uncharacterized transport system fused permease/ATPase subunit
VTTAPVNNESGSCFVSLTSEAHKVTAALVNNECGSQALHLVITTCSSSFQLVDHFVKLYNFSGILWVFIISCAENGVCGISVELGLIGFFLFLLYI